MQTSLTLGQPSWHFASDKVEAAITVQGGHLAPVRFHLSGRTVEPFSVAPWAGEAPQPEVVPLLQGLRGDFFCAPFGGNETVYQGEAHPPHGETAGEPWRGESLTQTGGGAALHLSLETKVRKGRVDKFIHLRAGETALYCRHRISGMAGAMDLGHHAMLKFPDSAGAGRISTSPVRFAQVLPTVFEDPARGGHSSLEPGAVFSRLDRVPLAAGGVTDVSRYPARRGFEDLVMVVHESEPDFAWTAVAFPEEGYVWFALKDPRVLRSTVLWISNGGRNYAPWNGRHLNVMGLEDVTAYFHYGLAESASENPISQAGIPTSLTLREEAPLTVNYIMAVAEIPASFERVESITRGEGQVILTSTQGERVSVPLDPSFLYACEGA